jgi:uncharacterized protein (TIGR01777 family)
MANVLITGGSGLVGGAITEKLKSENYKVAFLTRRINKNLKDVEQFLWDPAKQVLDTDAIKWADHIINLAGESVAQRWTSEARTRILNSRVDGTTLLKSHLAGREKPIKSFISASAIGYYGTNTGDAQITESTVPGDDFLAEVVKKWEQAIDGCQPFTERLVKIRIGLVLAAQGGALEKVAQPIKFGLGAPLGSGKQWMSWIHLNDLSNMFVSSLTSDRSGVFNGVAPNPVTNKEFTKLVAKQLHRPLILPNVPGFALKILLGEMSSIVLGGNKVMPVAFQKEEFKFEYNRLEDALSNLF